MDFLDMIDKNTDIEKIAHIIRGNTLSYSQLKINSDALASYLLESPMPDKSPVVVFGHKENIMIECFLACSKSSHPYIPVDVSTPKSRLSDILDKSGAGLIIDISGSLCTDENYNIKIINNSQINDIFKNYRTKIPDKSKRIKDNDVCYIIFTSGSTGKPKGVQITKSCLNSFISWFKKYLNDDDKIFLNQAPFSFDLSVMDTYLSLVTGATLHSIDKDMISNLPDLFADFKSSGITTWVSTPSFAEMCLQSASFNRSLLPNLKKMMFCGEILTKECVKMLFERFGDIEIINSYGPTEATVAVTAVKIEKHMLDDEQSLPVGYVKENCEIYLDSESSEITILGDSVGIGYLKDDELTQKYFFTKNRKDAQVRGYKTGDAGYFADSLLYYNGRIDNQIKLHGYRIEIEDIENNLRKLPLIKNAVVLPIKSGETIRYLTAVVIIDDNFEGSLPLYVKRQLSNLLPQYMVPRKIFSVKSLPINQNGKIDRRALMEEYK